MLFAGCDSGAEVLRVIVGDEPEVTVSDVREPGPARCLATGPNLTVRMGRLKA